MQSSDIEAARAVAFRFLGYSARSRMQMQRRLERGAFDPDVISAVISEFIELGYLDDEKFTTDWIEDRADRKRYGKVRLAAELHRTGVSGDTIKQAIAAINPEDELKRAVDAAESKQPMDRAENEDLDSRRSDEAKLAAFLQRRGFAWSIVKQVLLYRSENRNKLS